jgi:hypothetical protein
MSDVLLTRIAALEAQLDSIRKSAPAAPQFDPEAFRRAFVANPVGVLQQMGAPIDHITKVLVANAMGDNAPPELKVLASQGPQLMAHQALEAQVEALSRQLSTMNATSQKAGLREGLKTISADKSKYPNLAKAVAADPSLVDEELTGHGGTAEELAAKLEARLSKVAAIYAPPVASVNAANDTVQSTQDKPAGAPDDGVPPIPKKPSGVFGPDEAKALRDEIVRKHASQTP